MFTFLQLANRDANGGRFGHPDRAVDQASAGGGDIAHPTGLGGIVNLPDTLHDGDDDNHANDAHRIGDGKTDDRLGQHLLDQGRGGGALDIFERSSQGGRVGETAGENTRDDAWGQAQGAANHHDQDRGDDQHAEDEQVVAQSSPAKRGKELAPTAQSHGVNKNDQPQLINQLGQFHIWM